MKSKISGYSWTGKWGDGSLGWALRSFLANGETEPCIAPFPIAKGEKAYRVKVTIQLVKDKNGKPIKRRFR
jgi:hypothetical protein